MTPTVIPQHQRAAQHLHIDGPLVQIGWQGQTGTIYSLAEDFAHLEPGGFSPIYVHWGERCGHQLVEPGRIAYEAYEGSTAGVNEAGQVTPPWDDLSSSRQLAWTITAEAVKAVGR